MGRGLVESHSFERAGTFTYVLAKNISLISLAKCLILNSVLIADQIYRITLSPH